VNTYLQNVLNQKLKTNNPALCDFPDFHDNNVSLNNINMKRTRGSVRMQMENILTSSDISRKVNKLLSIVLPTK
jgi:hypothetical protein